MNAYNRAVMKDKMMWGDVSRIRKRVPTPTPIITKNKNKKKKESPTQVTLDK